MVRSSNGEILRRRTRQTHMVPIMSTLLLWFALTLLRMSAVSLLVFGRTIGFDGISRHTHAIKMLQHLLVLRNFATFSSKRMLLLVLTQELIMIFLEMNVLVLLSKMIWQGRLVMWNYLVDRRFELILRYFVILNFRDNIIRPIKLSKILNAIIKFWGEHRTNFSFQVNPHMTKKLEKYVIIFIVLMLKMFFEKRSRLDKWRGVCIGWSGSHQCWKSKDLNLA